jgi:hypothetical protein
LNRNATAVTIIADNGRSSAAKNERNAMKPSVGSMPHCKVRTNS